jgi:hypothetical protein
MSRNKPYRGATLLAAILALAAGVALVACAPTPPRLDLATMAQCPGEGGPVTAFSAPCVWDSERAPAQLNTPAWRWVLYAERCPVTTVQDYRTVRCIPRAEWGE